MRRTCWILSFSACALLAQTAPANEPTNGTGIQLPEPAPTIGLYPAPCGAATCTLADFPCRCNCRAMPAHSLAPGCCEPRRHCCDNAWDGYCQERAHWDNFWCKVGTGALRPCSHLARRAACGETLESQPLPTPSPAVPQQLSARDRQAH